MSSRQVSWLQLVQGAWGERWNAPDQAYQFSNGRRFDSTDRTNRGVYGVPILEDLLLETPIVPLDMRQPHLLQEDGGALGQE